MYSVYLDELTGDGHQTQCLVGEYDMILSKHMQYADFEEAQEEAIPCHSRRGIKRESIMTHS
jgi:hypothetical protein